MDRGRLRWGGAIFAAVVVAEVAVVLLRPRSGVIEPARVRTESYFSTSQVERARAFRRPQLAIYGGVLAVELGVLALLVARPPRILRRTFRRPALAGAAAGAALSVAVSGAVLPLQVVARERAKEVGLVTQSWGGYARDKAISWSIGGLIAGLGAATAIDSAAPAAAPASAGRRYGPRRTCGGRATSSARRPSSTASTPP